MMHRVLILIIAVGFCHAQRPTVSEQDGFVFPGEADRPSKFPLNTGRPTSGFPGTTRPTGPTSPQRTTSSPGDSLNPTTPSLADYNRCVDNCRATSEYNPVCGTDNVVYSNPGRLSCAANCGNNVQVKNFGQCAAGAQRG